MNNVEQKVMQNTCYNWKNSEVLFRILTDYSKQGIIYAYEYTIVNKTRELRSIDNCHITKYSMN